MNHIRRWTGKEDGLYFYREIVRKSGSYLKPGGHLLFEIGYDQAEAVSMLMQTQGYEEIEAIRDLGRSGPGRERKKKAGGITCLIN